MTLYEMATGQLPSWGDGQSDPSMLEGIGQKTVKEIREIAERVAEHLADRGEQPKTKLPIRAEDQVPVDPQLWSVDLLSSKVVGSRVEEEAARLLKGLLGLDPEVAMPPYAPQQEVAEALKVNRAELQEALEAARKRWSRQPWMTALRDDIARLMEKHSGVMTGEELAEPVMKLFSGMAEDSGYVGMITAILL